MKTGILIFSIIFVSSASSSQAVIDKCIQEYVSCAVPLINKHQDPVNCNLAVPFIGCVTNVSRNCDANHTALLEKFGNLLENVCYPDDEKKSEWNKGKECVIKNAKSFTDCTADIHKDACEASSSVIGCIITTTHQKCGNFMGELVDKLLLPVKLLAAECTNTTLADNVTDCIMKNTKNFLTCKLEGKLNNTGDVCSSLNGFTQCLVGKIEQTCGVEGKTQVQKYMEDISFVLQLCTNVEVIKQIPIAPCDRGILKCNVDIFNVEKLQCTDISNYVSCLADSAEDCKENLNLLVAIVLQRYKSKFPEYCDKDSSFSKNILKEYPCINENMHNVVATCREKLEKENEVVIGDSTGVMRGYVNFINCLGTGISEKCNQEAQGVVNDILYPLRDSLDDSCRMLTGKRCNSACGLEVATWVFFASVAYLLTRRHE